MCILNCLEFEYSTIGEFGIVYKAKLVHWHGEGLPKAVAVKTLKGTIAAMMNVLTGMVIVLQAHMHIQEQTGATEYLPYAFKTSDMHDKLSLEGL